MESELYCFDSAINLLAIDQLAKFDTSITDLSEEGDSPLIQWP